MRPITPSCSHPNRRHNAWELDRPNSSRSCRIGCRCSAWPTRSRPTRCAPGTTGSPACSAVRSVTSPSSPKSTAWQSCCATKMGASASARRAATGLKVKTSPPTSKRSAPYPWACTTIRRDTSKYAARCICRAWPFKRSTTNARPMACRCSPTRAIARPDRFASSTHASPPGDRSTCSSTRWAKLRVGNHAPSGRCWRLSEGGDLRPIRRTGEPRVSTMW